MKKLVIFLTLFASSIFLYAQDTLVFKDLKEALKNPELVYVLELKRLKGDDFPMEVFQFKNLESLNLSKNSFRSIPYEIGQLKKLRYLNLSKNNIKKLPESIGDLSNLEQLIISQNVLTELPRSIGKLKKLSFLDIWSNELDHFPDEIANCESLKTIDMRGILMPDNKHAELKAKAPQAKIYLTPGCNCGH
jgi:Leucine-rich repeat (LRR) protein